METQEVVNNAIAAVTALAQARGLNGTFPFDAIWAYAPQDVPSRQRPAARRPLVNGGYIVSTGGMINSETPARAGSKTPEYRPGPFFLPPPEVPPTAVAQPVAA
jgi:hypothetical protein